MGVLHEYIKCIDPIQKEVKLEGDYYVDSRRLGFRNNDSDKYKKDADILSKAYHAETDQGLKDRYAFYAAQSYKDSDQIDYAIEWYTRVLSSNNWAQEKYMSCMRLGDLYHRQGKFEETIRYYTKTMEYDPERIEGIVHLCRIFYEKGLHTMVNVLYEKYKHYSLESMDLSTKLFLSPLTTMKFLIIIL
jgi:tetratricopeptide (TPR) repeat protein